MEEEEEGGGGVMEVEVVVYILISIQVLWYRTTNRAKEDDNMQFLNLHMFHIGLLPGVFAKYSLGAGGVFKNILWARKKSFKKYFWYFLKPLTPS